MSGGEFLFAALTLTAFGLYSAIMLWLTLTYHDHQRLLGDDR